ncbi:PilZ domain-containing protein [Myxococcota bacterium]|nr:PilZ domain-containing protein [Myxococcota bacterium]MBU1381962.1 PilZ domain-containing protein [Myxococcota bacterium]MBU1498472.1 PilZ domain-containing protein [Myxococcota bacterium]
MLFRERRFERFEYEAPVLYQTSSMRAWNYGIILDVSLGGLLIKSPNLPKAMEPMEIRLANMVDGNLIRLEGKIVRFVDPPRGPAMGIEFIIPESSSELKKLIENIKSTMKPIVDGKTVTAEQKDDAVKVARELLENATFMDYYGTLTLSFNALDEEVRKRCDDLIRQLSIQFQGIPEHESRLLHDGIDLVKRLSGVLGNPERRIGYDLSQGRVYPAVIELYAKRYNINLQSFIPYYNQKFPDKVKKHEKLMEKAHKELNSGNVEEGIRLMNEAKSLAPFHFIYN